MSHFYTLFLLAIITVPYEETLGQLGPWDYCTAYIAQQPWRDDPQDILFAPYALYSNNSLLLVDKPNWNYSVPVWKGDSITLTCSDSTNFTNFPDNSTLHLTCNSDLDFQTPEGLVIDWWDMFCNSYERGGEIELAESCWENSVTVNMGYYVEGEFLRRMSVCFDLGRKIPLFASVVVEPAVSWAVWTFNSDFAQDEGLFSDALGGQDIGELYTAEYARVRINSLVGLPLDSEKYMGQCMDFSETCITPQPIGSNDAFFYRMDMTMVARYINTAPSLIRKWTNNIQTADAQVHYYIYANWRPVELYAGTYGVATLPHEQTGEQVELYLYEDGVMPFPEFFWKIVYDPEVRLAVVLVIYNNPYVHREEAEFCADVSDRVSWLYWENQMTLDRGLVLACEYGEVARKVLYLPLLDVQGLLV